jgi:hypothetical protein
MMPWNRRRPGVLGAEQLGAARCDPMTLTGPSVLTAGQPVRR